MNDRSLDKFDVLILPPGYYNLFSGDDSEILKWIENGGRLVALGSAVRTFSDHKSFDLKIKTIKDQKDDFIEDMG